ncbi:MAG: hypothetical protein PHQ28_05970 [Mycobacterium sp.]|nr:hypothetical protein [Mycobacterium sp.]
MIARYRAALELGLGCVALVAAGVSWSHAARARHVAPIADGQPVTTSLVYNPQLLLLTLVLVTTAGVLAAIGITRLFRGRRPPNTARRRDAAADRRDGPR